MRIVCPHCKSVAIIRNSKALSDTLREASCQCTNLNCAHTFVVTIEATRTIAPSMMPNPRVHIPLSPRSPALPRKEDQPELPMNFPSPRQATG